MSVLAERLLAVHDAFDAAGLPHAFGGAIALAYCTREPRGTRDIDVNVFVDAARAPEVLDRLPPDVTVRRADRDRARQDGQTRVMWQDTPIDIFLDSHQFHREAARDVRQVPFEGTTIPVLGCASLIVFKAMFKRTRDWADIEAMLEAGGVDGSGALRHLTTILGRTAPAVRRLSGLLDRR